MNATIDEALAQFPRQQLTRSPTPLQPLEHLRRQLGTRLLLKRDDLTDLALGGDKPRKLEYEAARAKAAGATVLVTCGSAQSNHARLTTAAARHLGLECAVVLGRDARAELQGNLLTVVLMGAEIHLVDVEDHWGLDAHVEQLCDQLRAAGQTPYFIPVSGTTPISCLGYVRAGLELADQLQDQGTIPDAFYVPFGTGGIFTATLFAVRARGFEGPVIGISVNRDASSCQQQFAHWWSALNDLLPLHRPHSPGAYEIHDQFVGREYGDPTAASLDAILLLARTEGILLDPVYSGKTMAGFLAHQSTRRWTLDQTIVVLHSGGVPALFAYQDALVTHLERRGESITELLRGDMSP